MLKNNFLKFLCVFLLIYSILGGLLIPLSPNIERANYSKTDTTINFNLFTPKLRGSNSSIYLTHKGLTTKEDIYISPSNIQYSNDSILAQFPLLENFKSIQKGQSFDLLCTNSTDGDMYYFNAYFTDTSFGKQDLPLVKKEHNVVSKYKLRFPNRTILRESIRNLFFHVPMWFTMIALLIYSLIQSLRFLMKGTMDLDTKASEAVKMALFFGTIGILTGMIWAKHTWGAYWTNDPKLNGAAVGMLSYLAYIILRNSVDDPIKRAKLSAVYNVFSFTIYIVFIMVLPRVNDSLHPGNGGNPGFNIYEQDNIMRLFFYPAVIGWILLSFWILELKIKLAKT